MLACVNGTSPFPGISRTVFLALTFRCFSNIPTIMGTVTGEVLPRLKIRYGAGPRFFPPDPVLRPAVSSDATHPLTISSITRASPDNSGLGLSTLAGLEERDEGRDIAMNIRVGILHRISHPGLRRQVHHVRERHHIKKLRQQTRVVDVTLHHEDSLRADQFPPRFLQRRVVVVVEVVQPHHPVAPLFQGQGHVRPDESGGAGYQYRHPVVSPDLSGRAYLFLPMKPAPRGGEIPATGIHKRLKTQIRRRQSNQEQRPKKHRTRRRAAPVDQPVHCVPLLELPRRRQEKLLLQRRHFSILRKK
nr:hypothetical protein Ahy_A01g001422 [Ipomoea batatas]